MKIITSIAIALIYFGMTFTANAQPRNGGQTTATVEVSAKVVSAINIDVKQNLAFGKVNSGTQPELDPAFQSNKDVGGSAQNGKAVISGAEGGLINIDLDQSSYQMTNSNNNVGPTFTPSLIGNSKDNSENADLIYDKGTDQNTDIELGSEGEYHLFVGGDLGSIDKSKYEDGLGTYSTKVTVDVTYN